MYGMGLGIGVWAGCIGVGRVGLGISEWNGSRGGV